MENLLFLTIANSYLFNSLTSVWPKNSRFLTFYGQFNANEHHFGLKKSILATENGPAG
jgi:hypothetical protein